MSALLADAQGTVIETMQADWPRESVGDAVATRVVEMQHKASARGYQIAAIGVSVPENVHAPTDQTGPSNVPPWQTNDLARELAVKTQLPVVLEPHVSMAVYCEFTCGAAVGGQNVLLVDLGPDIHAGLILQGRLYRGASGHAGGFGHMTVNPDGLECECGNVGCLETIASGTNFVRRTKERLFKDHSSSLSTLALPHRGDLTPYRIAKEALEGDDFALMMVERTGRWIGLAVANVVNLLNLDTVVLSGDVVVADDLLLRPVTQEVQKRGLAATTSRVRIVASTLGEQASAVGAAMLARDSVQGKVV
jgi:glucokinase